MLKLVRKITKDESMKTEEKLDTLEKEIEDKIVDNAIDAVEKES